MYALFTSDDTFISLYESLDAAIEAMYDTIAADEEEFVYIDYKIVDNTTGELIRES